MSAIAVGLIGGIASGKSLAAHYFTQLGVQVIDADQIARLIVIPHSLILQEIAQHFGPDILTLQGELNRPLLKQIIFANPVERIWLEDLMHPIIRREIELRIDAATRPYCVVAIPLLKQRKDYPKLKHILLIDSPESLQIERLQARDHISTELAEQIFAAQPSRAVRLSLADTIIVNEGSREALFAQIKAFDQNMKLRLVQ